MKSFCRAGVAVVLGMCAVGVVGAQAPSVAEFIALVEREKPVNKGRPLPVDYLVEDALGRPVALAKLMSGATTVVAVEPKCPPCQQLATHIATHPPRSGAGRTIILQFATKPGARRSGAGAPTTVYRVSDAKHGGFLATSITPTTFFFDSRGVLLGRRSGLVDSPEETLAFPKR